MPLVPCKHKTRAAHFRRMLELRLTHPTARAILDRMTDEELLQKYEEHKRISVVAQPVIVSVTARSE